MRYQVVTGEEWVDRIVEFDAVLDARWICDVTAVRLGGQPHVRREAVALYLKRARSTVIVATEADALVGYLIGDDDTNGRGGGRGRWISASSPAVIEGIVKLLAETYGWAWGRITNPVIAEVLISFGCIRLRADPMIFTYGKED